MSLHERIAKHLGWTIKECQSFSLQALRDIVTDAKLRYELTEVIQTGRYISQ